jgi:hypothetical protein
MKQITIYDLLPLLKKGWVCCDPHGCWMWFRRKPYVFGGLNFISRKICDFSEYLPSCFNIAPFDGDWQDSLIKVEHKEEE